MRTTLMTSMFLAVALAAAPASAQSFDPRPKGRDAGWGGWGPGMMMGPSMMGPHEFGMMCDPRSAGFGQWRLDRIEGTIKLNETQKTAFENLKAASLKADQLVRTSCPNEWPATAPARLAAMEKRHEAMLDASRIIRPALEAFYATLEESQRNQFDAFGPRGGGWQGRGWWYNG